MVASLPQYILNVIESEFLLDVERLHWEQRQNIVMLTLEELFQCLYLILVLERVKALHEYVKVIFEHDGCEQILKKLNVDIMHATKLQAVESDDGILYYF